MTLAQWLTEAELLLQKAGIESPRLDAQVLAAHCLGQTRSWILAHGNQEVTRALLDSLLDRRLRREPLAYIVGSREFYGRSFIVSPAVLIPRQETEALVRLALMRVSKGESVADLGTGSGCIAITLALECPGLFVTGVDLSPSALRVAMNNRLSLGAAVEFLPGDLLEPLQMRKFDLIISNPPYIGWGTELMPEVGKFEPQLALFAKENGMEVYRRLAQECSLHTSRVIVEAGDGMAEDIRKVFEDNGWRPGVSERDLDGWERALEFLFPTSDGESRR
ncbi:MAG: peptide chain release factor N(5)-glutamine methyltransferase [Fimbriimonadaceae bacterium]|jgi:release factor glutamine methyltransferase|nr:peptide chain release factor N(5)-glutamine methyltransferase [Fimbriimonadaceae bacterium]